MTSLFLEYEAKAESKKNAESLVGKYFYWSIDLSGEEIKFSKVNAFMIVEVTSRFNPDIDSIIHRVRYRYLDGLSTSNELDYIMKYASPCNPDDF